jgi:hypothetical protein
LWKFGEIFNVQKVQYVQWVQKVGDFRLPIGAGFQTGVYKRFGRFYMFKRFNGFKRLGIFVCRLAPVSKPVSTRGLGGFICSRDSMGSMGSKGWGFSAADVGVFTSSKCMPKLLSPFGGKGWGWGLIACLRVSKK